MTHQGNRRWAAVSVFGILLFVMACSQSPTPSRTATPTTLTPTTESGGAPAASSTPASACEGLSGGLEMQILVGPSEAVGMEPVAVGDIPFSVVSEGEEYIVQGGGAISYQEVLEREWGTYTVSFEMEGMLSGECSGDIGNEKLNVTAEMSGEQLVEVRAEGFQGDYPWSGSQEFNLSLPLEDGAVSEGEGWAFVLHLNE
ncbi:MAG: hypothetical protein PVG32_12650 [Anaerolineales bacterium]